MFLYKLKGGVKVHGILEEKMDNRKGVSPSSVSRVGRGLSIRIRKMREAESIRIKTLREGELLRFRKPRK